MLVERGRLPSLDTPMAEVWPEFGAHGKDRISIGDVLAHRAGLSALRADLSLEEALDDRILAGALAGQEPLWSPGQHHMYHAVTIGGITADLVRRAQLGLTWVAAGLPKCPTLSQQVPTLVQLDL